MDKSNLISEIAFKKQILNESLMTTSEVALTTRFSPKTIYNKIYDGTLREGVHFYRPTKRRLLFRRVAIMCWLKGLDPIILEGKTRDDDRR